jgi:hypothetical protein
MHEMMIAPRCRPTLCQVGVLLLTAALPACSLLFPSPKLDEPVGLIAVMPIERDSSATGSDGSEAQGLRIGAGAGGSAADAQPPGHDTYASTPPAGGAHGVAPGAERVVTAEIYDVLSSSPEWRFVPDLTVSQALNKADVSGDLPLRAGWLGKQVGADSVLFGTVSRYVERVGAEYGVKQPAAVAIKLKLLSVKSGAILWTGSFDQEQQPLSSNLLNWWQFWSGGPKWFTAQEFAHIAVERLLDNLKARME